MLILQLVEMNIILYLKEKLILQEDYTNKILGINNQDLKGFVLVSKFG